MLTVILLAVGLPVLWCFGTGYTAKLLDKETNWYESSVWMGAVFVWPILLAGMWGFKAHGKLSGWIGKRLDARQEAKRLPPISILPGARIDGWDQYSRLMALCSEFEASNGIDAKSLAEKNP